MADEKRIQTQLALLKRAREVGSIALPPVGSWPKGRHWLDERDMYAICAAVLAGRPLLVRGEPGVGKSQLARAAAAGLGRQFLATVVQPDTDYQDLLWSIDYTQRLADAQTGKDVETVRDIANYIAPGALWWALNWKNAEQRAEICSSGFRPPDNNLIADPMTSGVVLLIDELDKADISVANGLLEVLGNRQFNVEPLAHTVRAEQVHPLVIMTTNDTRELPAALVRRCVSHRLRLPSEEGNELFNHFIRIGETHHNDMSPRVLQQAAKQILEDRRQCQELPKTGLAEYVDLLNAIAASEATDEEAQLECLNDLAQYFWKSESSER